MSTAPRMPGGITKTIEVSVPGKTPYDAYIDLSGVKGHEELSLENFSLVSFGFRALKSTVYTESYYFTRYDPQTGYLYVNFPNGMIGGTCKVRITLGKIVEV